MFLPHDFNLALLMMITSAVCWGSWANTYKGVKNYRFELFYWDYAIGIFLVSLVLAFTMGSTANDSASFLNNVRAADPSNIVSTLLGGAIFNLANLLLVAGIDMAGLATAFPVSIGIARRRCGLRRDRRRSGRQSIRPSLHDEPVCFKEEHHSLRRIWRPHGAMGAVRDARHDTGEHARALQCCGLPDAGSSAFLFRLEYLLHEEAACRRAGSFRRFFSRTAAGSFSRTLRRLHLGPGHGLQSGCREVLGGRHFLRNRTVGANGRCALGCPRLEGI